jgi:hypothetical protein
MRHTVHRGGPPTAELRGTLTHAQPPDEQDRILNRKSAKWREGFVRRQGEPLAAQRAASQDALEQRRVAHDAKRLEFLRAADARNGFDAVLGQQTDGGARDDFEPRGPRRVTADGSEVREVEVAVRMREPNFRFFRIEDPDDARLQHRTAVLLDAGLKDGKQKRFSSELGFGRRDIKSFGAADAFGAADYGGTAWVHELEQAGALDLARLGASGGGGGGKEAEGADGDGGGDLASRDDVPFFLKQGPRDVWDVGRPDPDALRRRAMATQRAPNRIFDTTSAPVVLHAMPDPVQRALRETRDILRSRPPRPADRPASFTAQASALAARRVHKAQQSEVDLVRALDARDE